jgi:hypothetical protein
MIVPEFSECRVNLLSFFADPQWLRHVVPQRSLTDELDHELAGWRRPGLRVERLSGEHAVDIERIRDVDLWVATTERVRDRLPITKRH